MILRFDLCRSVLALDTAALNPLVVMDDTESNSTWLLAWNEANNATVSASRRTIRLFRRRRDDGALLEAYPTDRVRGL
jgi:predicted deacetylase